MAASRSVALAVSMATFTTSFVAIDAAVVSVNTAKAASPGNGGGDPYGPESPADLTAPNLASATALASARGTRVRVDDQLTDSSTSYVLPDGTQQVVLHADAVRVPGENGWANVDTHVSARGGRFAAAATESGSTFSPGGDGALVRESTPAGDLGVDWPNVLPPGRSSGSDVDYSDVAPGVDLAATSLPSGYELTWTVKQAPTSAPSFRLPVTLPRGYTLTEDGQGGAQILDRAGNVARYITPSLVHDASVGPDGEPQEVSMATTTVDTSGAQPTLVITPDPAIFSDPGTEYPVTVDPDVLLHATGDNYTTEASPTVNSSAGTAMTAGVLSGGYRHRMYTSFDTTSILNVAVGAAYLGLFINGSACIDEGMTLGLTSGGWNVNNLTWNNQPATFTTYDSTHYYGGNQSNGATACPTSATGEAGGQIWYSGTATQIARAMTSSANSGKLLEVRSTSESNTTIHNDWMTVASSEGGHTPYLSIYYNKAPSAPSSPTTNPAAPCIVGTGNPYLNTLRPTLKTTVSDPNGGQVQSSVGIYHKNGASLGAEQLGSSVGSGGTSSVTVPSGWLADGSTYSWKARGWDGLAYSPYGPWCDITIDATKPALPTISSIDFPAGAWTPGKPNGTFTVSSSDATSGVDHYVYGLDATPSTATPSGASSLTINPMPGGWHTLNVAAVDRAGNWSATNTYTFGASSGLTSPLDGTVTQQRLLLTSQGQPAAAGVNGLVTYYYRRAGGDAWAPIPASNVSLTGTGLPFSGWPYKYADCSNGTACDSGVPSQLTWDVKSTLSSTDGPAQVSVCFGPVTACPTSPGNGATPTSTSSLAANVSLDQNAFDASATGQVAPGEVNLLTGNFQVAATDASVPGNQGNTLSVGRSFNSKTPTTPGIFGPGWTPSLPVDTAGVDYTGLADTGSALTVTDSDQTTTSFAHDKPTATSYTATGQDADSGLSITAASSGCAPGYSCYQLTDLDGNTVLFQSTAQNPPAASLTTPVQYNVMSVTEQGSQDTTTFSYAGGLVDHVISPTPPNGTCIGTGTGSSWAPGTATTWSPGCRGMKLNYVGGLLSSVTYDSSDGVNPLQVDVACYSYTNGHLSDAWDPRDIATATALPHPISCGSPVRSTHYDYDASGRILKLTPAYAATNAPIAGWQMTYDASGGLTKVDRAHLDGSGTETTTVLYGVALTGDTTNGYRPDLTAAKVGTWAQTDVPAAGTAICLPGSAVTTSAGDLRDCTISYLDANGRAVNSASYAGSGISGWHITTSEYDAQGHEVRALTAADREEALSPTTGDGAALGLPSDTAEAALQLSTLNLYTPNTTDGLLDLTSTFGPYHQVALPDGSVDQARTYTTTAYDNSSGDTLPETGHTAAVGTGSLHLPVIVKESASLSGDAVPTGITDTRETDTYYYTAQDSITGWKFRVPEQTIVDPGSGHLAITSTSVYDPTYGRVTQTRMPSAVGDTGGTTAGTTDTTYYNTASGDSQCNTHPEWDGLVCKTYAANLTPTAGLPSLITSWVKNYDFLNRATEIDESSITDPTHTRINTTVYGFNSTISSGTSANPYANTAQQAATTGGVGGAVNAATTTYSVSTGLPTATSRGAVADATSYDDFGRIKTYTDNTSAGSGQTNTATTNYDPTHGWVIGSTDAHTASSFSYNGAGERRRLPTSETATAAGIAYTFTGGYDPDAALISQTDPNAVTMTLNRDETGQLVALTDTQGGQPWFDGSGATDAVTPSVHGQWASHAGPAGAQTYSYDPAGRLTKAQDTPTGGNCTLSTYSFTGAYGSDSNRYASATATLGTPTCPTSTGAGVTHTYDAADRLTDTGVSYDTYGRITSIPPADVTGGATLATSYYTNDLVQSETQGTTTQAWTLDAESRLAGWTLSANGTQAAAKTNHYDQASNDSPDWTAENSAGTQWTAYITDLNGNLGLSVDQTGTPTFQYPDLHGDEMGIAGMGSSAPTVNADFDEFGGNPGTSRRYGWLGAKQRSADDLGGLLVMGVRLYNPTLGRFLQTDSLSGGSANDYDYANQDPINQVDLSGLWASEEYQGTRGAAKVPRPNRKHAAVPTPRPQCSPTPRGCGPLPKEAATQWHSSGGINWGRIGAAIGKAAGKAGCIVNETFNPIPGTGHGGGELAGAGAGQHVLGKKIIVKTVGTAVAKAGEIVGKYNMYSGAVLVGWGVYQATKSC